MAAIVKIGYNYNNDESPNNNEETKINNQTSSPLSEPIEFYKMAKFPAPNDNCAIATCTIEAGTQLLMPNNIDIYTISHRILEGHRFAGKLLQKNDILYSWGLPFGEMIQTVKPGTYLVNNTIIEALERRNITNLPNPNFQDKIIPYILNDDTEIKPCTQVPLYDTIETFQGFKRKGDRGTGTRNYIVIMSSSNLSSPYAREIAKMTNKLTSKCKNIDGVVPVAHTEGSMKSANHELVLRTLAGFTVHPNVGAMLIVDFGYEDVQATDILSFDDNYFQSRLNDTRTKHLRLTSNVEKDLVTGKKIIQDWIEKLEKEDNRSTQQFDQMKIALQCGGSDAFSGVSANPTVGSVAKEVLRNGGGAVLAETDELIGAESHILAKVRNRTVAKKFLQTVQNFKDWMSWHGQTAENNPSGGNKLRGIYNITLKSIGAGMKKPKDVRLDYVVDYGELQKENYGYTFMNSPGNDLESVAGQVATGCNFILFTTGNGAVTNHPFVPTLKVITTTRRYELLKHDMDFNAGRFQDPSCKVPIDELGKELFNKLKECASGKRTIGEIAGHSQVQLWRSWTFTNADEMKEYDEKKLDQDAMKGDAKPILFIKNNNEKISKKIEGEKEEKVNIACNYIVGSNEQLNNNADGKKLTSDSVALIIATSLCSSEVSQQIADILNETLLNVNNNGKSITVTKNNIPITRFVACAHTEGCGSMHADGNAEANIPFRTLLGHLKHPNVVAGFLIEHGCEKHHNKYFKQQMKRYNMNANDYGWASIQLGGGLKNCINKCMDYFFPYEAKEKIIGQDKDLQSNNANRLKFNYSQPSLVRINNNFPMTKMKIGIYSLGNNTSGGSRKNIIGNVVSENLAIGASEFIQHCLENKAVPIMSSQCSLLKSPFFLDEIFESQKNIDPTIAFSQIPPEENENSSNGLHIMNSPTKELIETFTAFAASGCIVTIIFSDNMLHVPNHPFMPCVLCNKFDTLEILLQKIIQAIEKNSLNFGRKNLMEGFQIARGLTGISV